MLHTYATKSNFTLFLTFHHQISDEPVCLIAISSGAGPLACTSCPAHFMLDGGLCMECLGSQYYDSPTQTCKTCHESCRSCTGPGQYSCQTCAFPLHLDRLNNQCVPCCANDASPEDQSCCHCDKDTGMYAVVYKYINTYMYMCHMNGYLFVL